MNYTLEQEQLEGFITQEKCNAEIGDAKARYKKGDIVRTRAKVQPDYLIGPRQDIECFGVIDSIGNGHGGWMPKYSLAQLGEKKLYKNAWWHAYEFAKVYGNCIDLEVAQLYIK